MTFFDAFCGNTVSLSTTTLFFVGAVIQLFGEIPYKNRKHYCRIFGSLILFIAFCAFAGTLFYLPFRITAGK